MSSLECFALNYDIKKNKNDIVRLDREIVDMQQDARQGELETCFDEKLNITWFDNPTKVSEEKLILSRTKRDLENVTHHVKIMEHRIQDIEKQNEMMESTLQN